MEANEYTPDFWTEDMMLKQRAAFLNIIRHPDQFPRANLEFIDHELQELEFAMVRLHPTVRVLQAITGA